MLTTVADFVEFQGCSGNYSTGAITTALILAESRVTKWLCTFLEPTQAVEEFDWPVEESKVQLRYVRLVSVDMIDALYWIDSTTSSWVSTSSDKAFLVYDYSHSIVRILDTLGQPFNTGYFRSCPTRVRVTYKAGFTAAGVAPGTADGTVLRAGIFTAALGFLETTIGIQSTGNVFIPGYSAAGYSESRQLVELSGAELIMNPHLQMAHTLLKTLEIRRPIQLGIRKKVFFR